MFISFLIPTLNLCTVVKGASRSSQNSRSITVSVYMVLKPESFLIFYRQGQELCRAARVVCPARHSNQPYARR